MTDIKQFVSNLQDFLEYKKEKGFQTLDVSPETLAALKPAPAPKTVPKPPAFRAAPAVAAAPQSSVRVTGKTLEEMEQLWKK